MTGRRLTPAAAVPAAPLSPAEQWADKVLQAAGSALRHYDPWSREKIVAVVAELIGDWLPIKSAPKDGTLVLGSDWETGTFHLYTVRWVVDACFPEGAGWMYGGFAAHPTFWRPLPEPPPAPVGEGAS